MAKVDTEEMAMEIANNVLDIVLEQLVFRKKLIDHCHTQIDYIQTHWKNYHSPSEAQKGYKDILEILEGKKDGTIPG